MKVKKIKRDGIKNWITFKNGLVIVVPITLPIEVGMDLKLKFDGITPILDYPEFALMFSLSNEVHHFNLYVSNVFCDEDDDMNLYSSFMDFGNYDINKAVNNR